MGRGKRFFSNNMLQRVLLNLRTFSEKGEEGNNYISGALHSFFSFFFWSVDWLSVKEIIYHLSLTTKARKKSKIKGENSLFLPNPHTKMG